MPPKMCGKCTKIVYPTEELKCLDKVWHKGCFKCSVCNMTLNMKNYKGYDKLPYCNAHYPKTKPTTVADTPEIRRIAENTKIQSNRLYHQDFEASKHTYTQICDTPEMRTHLANTKNISMIKYHEEFEKQKGKKITVADDPEVMRVRQNMEVISNVSYHGDKDRRQQMEMARPAEQVEAGRPYRRDVGSISEYDPMTGQATPYSNRNSAGARQVYDSNVGKVNPPGYAPVMAPGQRQATAASSAPVSQPAPLSQPVQPYGFLPRGYYTQQPPQQQYQPPAQPQYQPPPPQQPPQQPKAASKGMVCKAMYDYDAADSDEVSFIDGDLIIFCQPIDEGWMDGQVERTGKRGMLPSNYVEVVNQ